MKTQANIQKCPLTGSVKSIEKSVIKVSIHKLKEIPTESRYTFITGVIRFLNEIGDLITFNKRYFILLGDSRDKIHPVTGYAVIDAVSKTSAIKQVREILNVTSSTGYGVYYISLVVRVNTYTRDLKAFAAFCNAEWIMSEVEYE
ncbi:hypothetical protein F3R65_06500 [Salmonella enterica subsp. enterica]|nr:hypothetical protein [Salmonella enterica]ECW1001392.1 hypothetical protein [Salmonella enterica subsp. enterica]EDD9542503.1 hypothetical protein [Salmonella enterica subsp. enterica serovar Rissen]EDK1752353.1 hypothetical protein [Salmonella enterica subsp. enterica serovar Mississippi]EAY3692570.1 hypothetical protein [Salmonella enterica]